MDIWTSDKNDYRFRITIAKELWASITFRLADEETWSNFKSEVHEFQGAKGKDYTHVLHKVWSIMKQFQELEQDENSSGDAAADETVETWDGITGTGISGNDPVRQELASAARDYEWRRVFELLDGDRELINTTRPGGESLYAVLHQAAHAGAEHSVIQKLLSFGAWRTLRNSKGERPLEVARRKGHSELTSILTPVYQRTVPLPILERIQERFHDLIRRIATTLLDRGLRLPELEPLLEFGGRKFWFAVPGMYGGFRYWLIGDSDRARLAVQSWSRIAGGSGLQHDITANDTILVDKAFV